jgi:hypothetical protein
LNYSYPPLLY